MFDKNQSITIVNYASTSQKSQSNENHSIFWNVNKNRPQSFRNIQFSPSQFISKQIQESPLVRFNHRLIKCLREKTICNFHHSQQKQSKGQEIKEPAFNKRRNIYKKLIIQDEKINQTAFSLQMMTKRSFSKKNQKSPIKRLILQKKEQYKIPCINYPLLNEKQYSKLKNILTKEQTEARKQLIEQIFTKNAIKGSNRYQQYHVFKRYSYQQEHLLLSLKPKFGTEPLEENQQIFDNSLSKKKRDQTILLKDDFTEKYSSIKFNSERLENYDSQFKESSSRKLQKTQKINKFRSYKKVVQVSSQPEQFGPWIGDLNVND